MSSLKRLPIFFATILLISTSSYAEIKTYTHTVKQVFGGAQSPDDARIAAIAKAKREVLEQAGTYLESMTVVQNYSVTLDEVFSIAAGVLKVDIVSQKNYASENGFGVIIVAKVDVDLSVFEIRVSKMLEDRSIIDKYQAIEERNNELLNKIANLEEENKKPKALLKQDRKQEERKIKKEFNKLVRALTAIQWAKKVITLWNEVDDPTKIDPALPLKYMDEYFKLDPESHLGFMLRGLVYSFAGKNEEAMADFNKGIEIKKNDDAVYTMRGYGYSLMGKYDEAITDFNIAIQINPKSYDAYAGRALVYREKGKYKEAISDFSKAIEIRPKSYKNFKDRGNVFFKLGEYNKSIADYDKAIDIKSNFALAYNDRGVAYERLKEYDKAISDYNKTIEIKPNYALAYKNRGYSYKRLKEYDKAIADYDKAIEIRPDDADAYFNKGISYYYLKEYNKAIADYSKAIDIKPDHALAYNSRGYAYNRLKEYDKAIADYNKAIELNPKYAIAYNNRGFAWKQKGNYDRSCNDMRKACELGSCNRLDWAKREGICN